MSESSSPPIIPKTVSTNNKCAVLTAVLIPFAAFLFAIYELWGKYIYLSDVLTLILFYLITGLGITVGYHRLFTHRSFQSPKFIEWLLAFWGSMALQGPIAEWVAQHRKHHKFSDKLGDPHSPYHHEGKGLAYGLWFSHLGWMFSTTFAENEKYAPDICKDKMLTLFSRWYLLCILASIILPGCIAFLLNSTIYGFLNGSLWGGLVRIFLVHHATWSVNSICHTFGKRLFKTTDRSTNNFWCGILAVGEGWHNNHHAFPYSARHGFEWWQFDTSWIFILFLAKLNLAYNIKLPNSKIIYPKNR